MYSVTLHGPFGCRSVAELMPIECARIVATLERAKLEMEGHRVAGFHIRRVR